MTAASDYLENKWLDHVTGVASYTPPTNVYLALFSDNPGEDASGTELSGSNYARADITGVMGAPTAGVSVNDSLISFPQPSADWSEVTHFGIFDAASAGNLLFYGAVGTSLTPKANGNVAFRGGKLRVAVGGGSDTLNNALISHALRASAYSAPAALYLSLHADNGGLIGAEVTGGSYARTAVTFGAASSGQATNSATVTFPTPSAAWGLVQWAAIYDAASGGNRLYLEQLDAPVYVASSWPVEFAAGEVAISLQ